jgi:hypothetical protein
MDNKSKILIKIFFVVMFVSASIAFYRYIIVRDFAVIDSSQKDK